jgi:hypothetical protein
MTNSVRARRFLRSAAPGGKMSDTEAKMVVDLREQYGKIIDQIDAAHSLVEHLHAIDPAWANVGSELDRIHGYFVSELSNRQLWRLRVSIDPNPAPPDISADKTTVRLAPGDTRTV